MSLKRGDIVEIRGLLPRTEGAIGIVVAMTGKTAHVNWITHLTPPLTFRHIHSECDMFISQDHLIKITEATL